MKKISYICAVFRSNLGDIHIDESVFALSYVENVAVFNESRTTNSTHSCLDYVDKGLLYPVIPHIYSSVGYCIVYLIRVSHNLLHNRRNNLTLSFCTNPSLEVGGTTITGMSKYRLIVKVCYDFGWDNRFSKFYNGLKELGITSNADDTIINLESNEQIDRVNELSKKNRIQVRLLLAQEDNNQNKE